MLGFRTTTRDIEAKSLAPEIERLAIQHPYDRDGSTRAFASACSSEIVERVATRPAARPTPRFGSPPRRDSSSSKRWIGQRNPTRMVHLSSQVEFWRESKKVCETGTAAEQARLNILEIAAQERGRGLAARASTRSRTRSSLVEADDLLLLRR
jgi:hypothetical protein